LSVNAFLSLKKVIDFFKKSGNLKYKIIKQKGVRFMKFRKVVSRSLPVVFLLALGVFALTACGPSWNYNSMFLRGGFNGWSGSNPMEKAGSHEWKALIDLKKGTYEYKYEISGSKNWDEKNHWGAADDVALPKPGESMGVGVNPGQNIVLIVEEAGTYEFIFNDDTKKYSAKKVK
jgi:hypothetical protein